MQNNQQINDIKLPTKSFTDPEINKGDIKLLDEIHKQEFKQINEMNKQEFKQIKKEPFQKITQSLRRNEIISDIKPTIKSSPIIPMKTKDVVDTVLLVMCSNRPDYLRKTMSYILKYHPKNSIPIYISQDGNFPAVNDVISQSQNEFKLISTLPFIHIHHMESQHKNYENGYFKLADHFQWALSKVFNDQTVNKIIILEEDLQISPDFFEYFMATSSLLDNDPSLLTISAWNDNGFENMVKDPEKLYRSDFFPGLGWMMTRKLWDELKPKWPRAYWDDWLREPKNRQGRHIIRPEICRTFHFGAHGVSNSQYSEYLTTIKLNEKFVPFSTLDLSYLEKENWDKNYLESIRDATPISIQQFKEFKNKGIKSIRVTYTELSESPRGNSFGAIAEWAGIMNNIKAMVPRTAYKGIISFWKDDVKVHIVPQSFI